MIKEWIRIINNGYFSKSSERQFCRRGNLTCLAAESFLISEDIRPSRLNPISSHYVNVYYGK